MVNFGVLYILFSMGSTIRMTLHMAQNDLTHGLTGNLLSYAMAENHVYVFFSALEMKAFLSVSLLTALPPVEFSASLHGGQVELRYSMIRRFPHYK